MRNKLLYFIVIFLLLAILSLFVACDNSVDQPGKSSSGETVFLTVNTRSLPVGNELRSEAPSINKDNIMSEDRVHNLAMLIFDSESGEKVGTYIRENLGSGEATRAFTIEIAPGKYDFYFVANMPDMTTDLGEDIISNRQTMETYLNESSRSLSETLYHGASQTQGFPMARVYLNQQITEGGTIYQPKAFKPKQHNTDSHKVVVNTTGDGEDERPYVELIRVVAKLEVELTGSALSDVKEISFGNANRQFRLVEFESSPTTYLGGDTNLGVNTKLKKIEDSNTYIYYMPEAIVSSSIRWNDKLAEDNRPINYFSIKVEGKEFEIPIISNDESITAGYLSKAKGTINEFTPDYTIYRNHHYKYKVNISKQDHPIEIIYEVAPWNLVKKSLYMGYGYNVEVDGKNVTITNTVDACPPYHIKLETVDPFKLKGEGGAWVNVKELKHHTPGKSVPFELNTEPTSGVGRYLNVYFNNNLVKTFSK